MITDSISITDHIKDFSIEKEILGNYLEKNITKDNYNSCLA